MENWKDIEGFVGHYQVSDQGRVRSLNRTVTRSNNRIHIYKGVLLTNTITSGGKGRVVLCKDHIQYPSMVSVLVANAFCPNLGNRELVVHLDGDVSNDKPSNLLWVTRDDYNRHKLAMGSNNRSPRLKPADILAVKSLYATGKFTMRKIGVVFSTSESVISKIIGNKTYQGL